MSRCPNKLIIHLKRFTNLGAKIKTRLLYSEALWLEEGKTSVQYKLSSLVLHEGYSTQRGHYKALVKTLDGNWHEFNDNEVKRVPNEEDVLKQMAYILIY